MNKNYQSVSKAAEFRLAVWFLEAGWEVFIPAVQARQTDFVVRVPADEMLVAIEVKCTQVDTLNQGQLENEWRDGKAPFDYLVFIEGRRERGVILPRGFFKDRGRTLYLFQQDKEGYSRGDVRPVVSPYSFNLAGLNDWERAAAFVNKFDALHRHPPPLPSIGGKPN